jgi:PKD repeat protein
MKRALISRLAYSAGLLALIGGCTMKDQEAPPLSGPSEFGKAISVSVTPDVLEQNGASQSRIEVTARGPNGEPLRGESFRLAISVGGTAVDFGSLSARNIATGNDGRATAVYTAPAAPPVTTDDFTVVDIVVTPIGSDFNNTALRAASIRLVPPGVVIPPDGLMPSFTFTPTTPSDNQTVLFDASASQPIGGIAEYRWNFGDGRTGSGRTTTHAYSSPGTYAVTLTIIDGFNRAASSVQSITVGAGAGPTAAFVFSPAAPAPGQTVFFNAAGSRAAPGSTITGYQWDFGDGVIVDGGVTINHAFAAEGDFRVTLVVTDNAGRKNSVTVTVPVEIPDAGGGGGGGGGSPTASFTFSVTGRTVTFNGSGSTAASGKTIASYTWAFGDGITGTGVNPSHVYAPGSYTVVLTVIDSEGRTGNASQMVSVS